MERITGNSIVMVVFNPKGEATLAILNVPPPSFKDIVACSEAESLLEKVRNEHKLKKPLARRYNENTAK